MSIIEKKEKEGKSRTEAAQKVLLSTGNSLRESENEIGSKR